MITVVNIIPQSLSGETNQDSEPNLAVNPANPLQIAASAFTPNPMGGPNAPIYVSTDGGGSWTLNNIVPSAGGIGTGDITLRFAGSSNRLFTTILDGATGDFEVHRSANFTNPAVAAQLENRANEDQPYIQAATVLGGNGAGADRVYIGVNDFNAPGGRTATVEQTLDGGAAAPVFASIRVEKRTTLGQDGAQVRPAVHADGTIYAAFYRWISSTGDFSANTLVITDAEAIVVRDDSWGIGAAPFTALTDASDALAGRRVATGLSVPFNRTGVAANGQERWGGDISIAVDSRSSSTVFLSYSTLVGGVYTLRLTRSTDRGVTWSANLLTLPNAKNPAVAVNSLGKIGIVYQQLNGAGATQRWETHFRDSSDGVTWSDSILCTAPSQAPARSFSPYIGDYLHMMAVGKDFYGIFSANNTPDLANFPQGVTYQRNHNFVTKQLFALNGTTIVGASIDPFFFKVAAMGGGSDYYVRDWTDSAAVHDTGLEPSTRPVFYATSDVWNQRSNAAPAFVADQPQNQDPQNNAGNFAFARVSRNAAGNAETVNAEFLVAEFGTGSPYVSVATASVNFAAGDTSKVVSAPWTLGPTSSTHLCLAVQVSTASDPFVAPGLSGNTPGWPTTDLIVINDNNKAQRNMSVHYGLSGFGVWHYAVIRNASKESRDFQIAIGVGEKSLGAFKNLSAAGQGLEKSVPLEPRTQLTVNAMKPGESRWVALGYDAFKAPAGRALPVDFQEAVDGKIVNGFRINIVSARASKAVLEILLLNRAVFTRLLAEFNIEEAGQVVKETSGLLAGKRRTLASYLKFVSANQDLILKAASQLTGILGDDFSLGIAASQKALAKAVGGANAGEVFAAHASLLNKLDVAITLKQKN